ncbi:transcription antitermination factor NusB [Thalassoglobus sp.]|uniref:transcription antitermination factor NusB n=1 Tax=Thalassoglobus sp. TaxID=2795869 RepID=UPI003AA7E25E
MSSSPNGPNRGRRPKNQGSHPNKKKFVKSGASNARWFAFKALQANRERDVFVSRILDDQFKSKTIPSVDRKMATELANETVRRRATLDAILTAFVTRPQENVEADLWTILQLGCLQLACLPHIASHAAVHETVQLCEELRNAQAKPFINGVLRNIGRSVVSREEVEDLDLAELGPRQLPLLSLRGRDKKYEIATFDRDIFTNPADDALAYISQVSSLPEWLLQRLTPEDADKNQMLKSGLWMTIPGRMSLRVNLLQTDREKVLDVLEAAELSAHPGTLPEAIELDGSVAIIDLPGYREGWFSVQDLSAMSSADLLNPQPGEKILDLCAAPGGKSTHIAERLKNEGRVVACDTAGNRIRIINENAGRLQLPCIETHLIHEDGSNIPSEDYDAAIVDVPCSNTGVLGKRPEARWRIMPTTFRELIPLQMRLLKDAMSRVRPGGRVVYSTCSIDFEENRGVVDAVLSKHPEFHMAEERIHHPGEPADGGYQALLIRSEPSPV